MKQILLPLFRGTAFLCFFLCSILLSVHIHSHAQTSYQLSVDNVLPTNYVRSILQDKYGYLWFSTTSGLARYDGYQTDVLKPSASGNRKLMQDFRILNIKPWGDCFLWIRLRGHLYSCYDIEKDVFVDYTGDDSYSQPIKGYAFLSAHDMIVWGKKGEARRIHFDGERFSSVKFSLPTQEMVNFVLAGKDEYWVSGDGAIYLCKNGKFLQVYSSFVNRSVREVTEAAYWGGFIFLTTNDGIYQYDLKTRRLARSSYNPSQPHVVLDNLGNVIILAYDGSDVYYLTPRKTYHFQGIYNKHLLQLNSEPRYQFYAASDGKLWISTFGNGLFSYDTQQEALVSYADLLPSPYIFSPFVDKAHNLWVAVENMGVYVVNFSKSEANYLYYKDGSDGINRENDVRLLRRIGNHIYISNIQNGSSVANGLLQNWRSIRGYQDDVTSVAQDAHGRLFVGTRKKGIFSVSDGKNFVHTDNPASIGKGKLSDIFFDKKNRMWVSLFDSGLDVYLNGKFVHVVESKSLQTRNMEMDKKGNIWLCTSQGVMFFNPDELLRNHKAYRMIHVSTADQINDEVHCVYADSKGRIWIGSIGNGVKMIDGKDTITYTTRDGLADNNVQSIVEHKQTGDIWLGTDNGISRFRKGKFNNFFFGANSLENACTEDNAVDLDNGDLAFATHHGVMTFNPCHIHESKPAFPLAITKIEANGISIGDLKDGEARLDGTLARAKEFSISYHLNSLTFFFSDFYYAKKNASTFTYYLEGYDKGWSSLSHVNFAQYRNLPVGHYILHVRSCNANGVWSPKEAVLQITVRPPFYATWWAYLMYIGLVAVVIYYVYVNFRRISALRNKVKVENQLTEYKLRFFTNISHEFRTPLTIIQGDMERLKTVDKVPGEMKQPLSSMAKSVARMMRLINQLLEFRKMQNDKLQLALEKTDIIAFLQDIFLNFSNIAENKQINFMFLPFDKSYEMYVDCNYLDKIIYNLLSNALKYTPSRGEVSLRVSLNANQHLLILVEDTGVGVEKSRQSQLFQRFNRSNYSHDSIGIGLHLTAELVRVHHGRISYQDNQPHGSIFRIELPTDEKEYEEKDFMVVDNVVTIEENNQPRTVLGQEYHEMPPVPLNPYRVLVVEDDNDVREFLMRELRRYFEVDVATDGQEAWEKMQAMKPALVVSDVMMPRMDGYQLLKKVRTEASLSDLPVVLLTALTANEKRLKGIDAGADAYIEKPFHTSILIATCCQLLEQRNHLKQVYGRQSAGAVKAVVPEIIKDEQDKKFQSLLDTWLAEHITDPQLNIDSFAMSMGYGRTTFYKKMKSITGTTPNEYIRTMRMNKAAELLKDDRLTVAEVGYKVGVGDPYYFSKLFKSFFGISPAKYRAGKNN